MADDLQATADALGATKSQLFWAARNDVLIQDRYRITRTDTGLDVTDTQTIDTDVLAGGREPGIYDDLTDEEYHEGPGISSSQLKAAMEGAPIKAGIPSEDKAAFVLGRQVHMAVLEPERWEKLKAIQVPTPGEWRSYHHDVARKLVNLSENGSSSIEFPASFLEPLFPSNWGEGARKKHTEKAMPLVEFYSEHGTDFEPVDDERVEQVEAMRDSVLSHVDVDPAWFTEGRNELSVFWHEETDSGTVLCKARIDALLAARMFDLKTTRDASPSRFAKSVANFGYHVSASFYARGIAQVGEPPVEQVTLVAVEKSDPYLCCPYDIGHAAMAIGRELWTEALECVAAHLANPEAHAGYRASGEALELPGWADSQARSKIDALRRRTQQLRQSGDELPEALR